MVSIMSAPVYNHTNSAQIFSFLYTLISICYHLSFCDGHSNWCKGISHCNFGLHFPNSLWSLAFSCVPIGFLYIFFENIYSSSLPIFNWIIWCLCLFVCLIACLGFGGDFFFFFLLLNNMSSLYILDINFLSDKGFANIFSHFVGYLFIMLNISFCCAEYFSFM